MFIQAQSYYQTELKGLHRLFDQAKNIKNASYIKGDAIKHLYLLKKSNNSAKGE